ncbi:hypothetical protein BaRGS_00010969 [Batillaria attramentaria]|uniref:Uncharacterized protein n=1 Tax=Batillaria attramentaria TaxID=370345 RepID=A0ABD0LEN6_9CAEN
MKYVQRPQEILPLQNCGFWGARCVGTKKWPYVLARCAGLCVYKCRKQEEWGRLVGPEQTVYMHPVFPQSSSLVGSKRSLLLLI